MTTDHRYAPTSNQLRKYISPVPKYHAAIDLPDL